jgi:hypothetical protein
MDGWSAHFAWRGEARVQSLCNQVSMTDPEQCLQRGSGMRHGMLLASDMLLRC